MCGTRARTESESECVREGESEGVGGRDSRKGKIDRRSEREMDRGREQERERGREKRRERERPIERASERMVACLHAHTYSRRCP